MNKINKVIINSVAVVVALVGILNVIDYIYASNAVSAATSNLTMSATITSSMTTVVENTTASLDVTPSAGTTGSTDGGTFGKSSAVVVTTYTNTGNACTTVMKPVTTTALVGKNDSENTIPTLATKSGGYTEDEFINDRWGYQVGSGNYQPISDSNNIATYTSKSGNDKTNQASIYFAVRLSQATKADTYQGTVTFSGTCAQ